MIYRAAMNAWIRESRSGKSLFAIALLLALSIRVLIPTGFMPTATAQGVFVQLCSGMEDQKVAIEFDRKAPAEQHQSAGGSCVFAAGLGNGLLAAVDLPIIRPLSFGLPHFAGLAIADFTVDRLAAPPPPSHGPPALR